MADKKLWLQVDFDTNTVFFYDTTQSGHASGQPGLADAAQDVLHACGISDQNPCSMEVDTSKQKVVLTYRISDLEQRTTSILSALGLKYVSMGNAVDLLNLYINGLLPEAVTRKALELESLEDGPNKDVSELLRILRDGIKDDTDGASE